MKKILLFLFLVSFVSAFSQFNVSIKSSGHTTAKEAIIYTLNGSKDIIHSKSIQNNGSWNFQFKKSYFGILKVYFPDLNYSLNLISENMDVNIVVKTNNNKILEVIYIDDSNKLMDQIQDLQRKNELILPALIQIKDYYKDQSEFGSALVNEIKNLSTKPTLDPIKNPFVHYYNTNYNKFLVNNPSNQNIDAEPIISFIEKSNDYLETSSLLRPILISLLNSEKNNAVTNVIDNLLSKVTPETPRGQTVLSELIEIFDMYGMKALKEKYLTQAKNLKCTITDRLASTLQANKDIEIGAIFKNYMFRNAKNTIYKSIHDVKANHKVIIFWSSTCSHCEAELPKLFNKYNELKAKQIEVIGLSLDTEKDAYETKTNVLSWINDTELKGWNSSFAELYNIHATPTFFILDSNNKIVAKPEHVEDVLQFLKVN